MKIERRGRYDTQEDLINRYFSATSPILFSFDVVPLDHVVNDPSTPRIYISTNILLLSYDDIVEVYDLKTLQIYNTGESPSFNARKAFFSLMGKYDVNEAENLVKLRETETLTKMTIDEPGVAPKDFLLRKDNMIQKPFQTWTMMRLILNTKNGIQNDPTLFDMLNNNFILFNQKTVIYFTFVSMIYIIFIWLLRNQLTGWMDLALDILYGLIILIMLIWLYFSYDKILKRYQSIYSGYISHDRYREQLEKPVT